MSALQHNYLIGFASENQYISIIYFNNISPNVNVFSLFPLSRFQLALNGYVNHPYKYMRLPSVPILSSFPSVSLLCLHFDLCGVPNSTTAHKGHLCILPHLFLDGRALCNSHPGASSYPSRKSRYIWPLGRALSSIHPCLALTPMDQKCA